MYVWLISHDLANWRSKWHPHLSEWLSVSGLGNIYIWGNIPKMKWSAFAAEFEEIDENVEYTEKENEFDQVHPPSNALTHAPFSPLVFVDRKTRKKLPDVHEPQRMRR